jgi:GalNAc-alpha-(1->4)-GalNAc-alpha-(1->3)-diNAcBac-PP-undecaprenol alpha-1,4-N-acetyl-D-galactosaminyltransferase
MRILFVIFSLAAGGAERVASTLANHWVVADKEVTLVTLDLQSNDFYPLDSRVKRIALGLNRASSNWLEFFGNNFQRIRHLRALIRSSRPDVVVSFVDLTNILVLFATLGSRMPVIVSERVDPRELPIGTVATMLRRLIYRRARMLVVQTQSVGLWARQVVKDCAIRVIPNPVNSYFFNTPESRSRSEGRPTVLAMGRLEPQKGFDLLLTAFAQCARKHSDWILRIIGDGTERKRLRMLACKLGITSRVTFDGVIRETANAFRSAEIFVLSSRYEGFPNVLLEAMAFGLPVISADCPSGPREIIRSEVDGILVPVNDVDALAKAMDRLMGAEGERKLLGARAMEVRDRFSLARVGAMWQAVLDEAIR